MRVLVRMGKDGQGANRARQRPCLETCPLKIARDSYQFFNRRTFPRAMNIA
jgi:hypothetical protein